MYNVLRVFITLLILVLLATFAQAMPTPPKPFASDGCSMWFDGNWYDCCYAHDLDYWQGGTYSDRLVSDAKLARCVARRGYPFVGWLMHTAVRIGGLCWLPLPFRWGYGWDWPQCGPHEP